MLTTADRVGFPHRREWTAIVLAVLPFMLNLMKDLTIVNGRVTGYSDLGDTLLGIALVFVTFRNLIFIREGEAKYKVIRVVLTVVLLVVAAYHIASGLGLLLSMPYPFGYGA